MPADLGFTHIALVVADMEASLAFYADYANMHVVHRRNGQGRGDVVAWISDGTRPFVIVLIQQPGLKDRPLGPIGHLGVACASREDIDRLAARAAEAGILLKGPEDWGAPVGYWAYIADPDGNVLEISHGQQVELTVENRPG
ncbi:bleomycin resistance protein [Tardibacter chloracetimidivorans]|uniref:Bleomycin resistance protein n=1 Tax=Tardibacter chloracetimidivorans TaxID=1921510 RepID=A0A1L3ZXJ4_9SPHN|nr:VOC family protein [Tardibacter chloracetimidivorans]API60330.1 bleomycin resistance protein [Tardibacter chloracetimidivorans]